MTEKLNLISEGKAKSLYETSQPTELLMVYRDDTSAFDGKKKEALKGKGEINNKFKKIRMSYYQDNEQTPVFEQTINLNDQGVANFFRYDYPDYSLVLKLKKITLVNLDCN